MPVAQIAARATTFVIVGQVSDAFPGGEFAAHALARDENLGAKAARLFTRTFRQLVATDAIGKTEVVLNPWAAARLPADRPSLDDHGPEVLRCAVDSRAQARWPCPINRQVVLSQRRIAEPAELLADLPNRGALDSGAIREHADRQAVVHDAPDADCPSLLLVGKLDPLKWDVVPIQEVADGVALR